MSALAEARQKRIWRECCGEPGDWPIRCRRDLNHLSPHIGLHGDDPIQWPGEGNAVSAQTMPGHKCFGGSACP